MSLRPYQQSAVDVLFKYWERSTRPCILSLSTGCHDASHKILMADGSIKRADEIEVGDKLIGNYGITSVVSLHRGEQTMYKITPVKGEPFIVNGGHILHTKHYLKNRGYSTEEIDISVEEYIKKSKTYKHCSKLFYRGYDFGATPDIDGLKPYLIGAYLGDGGVFSRKERNPVFTNIDKPVIDKVKTLCEENGYTFKQSEKDYKNWYINSNGKFKKMMFDTGSMEEDRFQKHFPKGSLSWSREDRAELLAGLLDTDGSLSNNGIDFIQKNKEIAYGVLRLSRSLGIMATIHESYKMCQTFSEPRLYYRLNISGKGLEKIPMVKHKVRENLQKKDQLVTGFKVEKIGKGRYYGWEVDSPDHLYLDANLMIHHNSGKSHIVADIVERAKLPTLILQPSKEILEQNYEKLLLTGIDKRKIQICSASAGSWKIGSITLATIGTIYKHIDYCQHFKIIIVDETDVVPCDRADSQYMKFFAKLPSDVKIVGLTASAWRNQIFSSMYEDPKVFCRPLTRIHCQGGDKEWYGQWFWSGGILCNVTIPFLQENGYLSKTNYHIAETDWSFVRNVPGRVDYDTNGMERWCDIEANTSRFTQAIKWCIDNNYKTIVFTPNIDMNFRLKNAIYSLGGKAETMDSDHDTKQSRENKMERFRKGDFQFLVNVGMVGRGVDVPSVDAVVLCRPTKSLAVYMQEVGRCIRLDPNNPDKIAQILDLSGNVERFGKVEDVSLAKQEAVASNGWKFKKDVITIVKNGRRRVWDRVS